MKAESRTARLVLASPWFLLIFLVVPISVILSFTLKLHLPFLGPRLLLYNNACLALLLVVRFFSYAVGIGRRIRYGAGGGGPDQGGIAVVSCDEARAALQERGYAFDGSGRYGEKRDIGYIGTVILYGGIMMVLVVGTLDNMRQFSGTLLDGVGASTKLNKLDNYVLLNKGPMATGVENLPQMRLINQITPNDTYPMGATEAIFLTPDEKEYSAVLKPGQPFVYGDYDIFMSKLIFEPQIVIRTDKGQVVIDRFVKLNPLLDRRSGFSFFGTFAQGNLTGDVYYQPEKSRLKVIMRRDGKRVMNAELIFQGERLVGQADLVLTCEKMGQWSEIKVIRRRHMPLLAVGGMIALIGLLLRIVVKSQRVWLESAPEGCRVRTFDREALRLVGAAGK